MTAQTIPQLAYLFEAHFLDGSMIQQTQDDRSAIDPERRSAFYDVAQRIDEVAYFGIWNDQHRFVVDLRDGHFEVDGVAFFAEPRAHLATSDGKPTIPPGGKFRLVYFRDRQQDLHVGANGSMTPGEQRIAFRLGWEYTAPDGRKFEQTIVVQ